MLQLYDYYRSSACFRVRIALNLKGLDYQTHSIHLLNNGGEQLSPQYQAINPMNLVPSLQDGTHLLSQSLAIIEYLNDKHPTPPLLPTDALEKALVRSFALTIAADIHPLNNLRVLKFLAMDFDADEEGKALWYHHWIAKGFAALETQLLTHNKGQTYCFGNEPSLADLCLVPQLYNARRFACDLNPYPTLVRIDAACQLHPAFIKAWPLETEG